MSDNELSRREFLQGCGAAAFVIGTSGVLAIGAEPAGLPQGAKAVSETDPAAAALGFKHDVKKVDKKKHPQRFKADAKNQFCENCVFYVKVNDNWGKCQLIQNGLVSSKGWCISWQKKA